MTPAGGDGLGPVPAPGRPGHFDELHGGAREAAAPVGRRAALPAPLAPAWQRFFNALPADRGDLAERQARVQRRVRDDGASYNVYTEGPAAVREWPLELLPFIIPSDQWAAIERGVQQRTRMLNAVLADIYGPQHLLRQGLLPPSLVLAHPQYLRPMHGCVPRGGVHLHVAAFDLAHGPDGGWWIVSQRTQAPSGLGYLLENRIVVAQQLAEPFCQLNVQRVAASFKTLLDGLMQLGPAGEHSRMVLLTPGPYSETYFEQVFLARYLGLTLVEGTDLTVRRNRVYLKTMHGLERVHVLLRRLDDDFLDPLEMRPDSALGVPGLMQALRAGEIVVANAPGAGFLESPGLAAFWPAVAQHLLGEDLALPAATSWWCGEASVWASLRQRVAEYVVAPSFPASACTHSFEPIVAADLTPEARAALVSRIDGEPAAYTLTARVHPSETPVWRDGALETRPAVVRVFALSDGRGGWRVLPGGMTRLAAPGKRDSWLTMQQGSASVDTWMLTEDEVDTTSLLPKPLAPADLERWHRTVTSRAAENLFWLGRYTERAENAVSLARLMLEALPVATAPVLEVLAVLAQWHGLVPRGVPSPLQSARVFERALVHALTDVDGASSVGHNLNALRACAYALRDRLSQDHWRLICETSEGLAAPLRASSNVMPDASFKVGRSAAAGPRANTDVLGVLGEVATRLSAITGAQTDRMMRDDGWRLLSVGRQIERLDTLSQALAIGFEHRLHETDEGFTLLLGLFDSLITYRAQFQARRELPPLLHLLVLDTDNPRSLAWVARTMRDRFIKLARRDPAWAAALADKLPRPEHWSLEALCTPDGHGTHAALIAALRESSQAALGLSDAISQRMFSHTGAAERHVWQ
ncbi:MAG TPA: circularly permuted type 2 ATP-grasp protein [Burkholderiaceae bacterium]|nr:circularly permuted type 2 ATP-grasp protein [Burkholderiaceae bacterium]